ncbi:uncharacterized protein LOC111114900 isoform X3 [Crassostrea virginica]
MGLLSPEEQWLYCSQTMASIVFLLCMKNNGFLSFPVMILGFGFPGCFGPFLCILINSTSRFIFEGVNIFSAVFVLLTNIFYALV